MSESNPNVIFMTFVPPGADFPKKGEEKRPGVEVIRPHPQLRRPVLGKDLLMVYPGAWVSFEHIGEVSPFLVTEPEDLDRFIRHMKLAAERVSLTKSFTHHLLTALIDDRLMPLDPGSIDVADLAMSGLPTDVADLIINTGTLTRDELHNLVIPERTLRDRKKHGKSLAQNEADRLLRVIRVIERATAAFESREKAMRWLPQAKAPTRRSQPHGGPGGRCRRDRDHQLA